MEPYMILIINVFCILLGIIGLWKIPLSAFFGVLISLTVLFNELVYIGFIDSGLRLFTILTIIICSVCLIGGYNKNG